MITKKKLKRQNDIWIFIFLLPTVVIFLMFFAIPLVTAIISSFTRWNGFTSMEYVGVQNYKEIFSDSKFHAALLNTLKWALLAAFVHVPFGILVALVLSKKPKGWRLTRAVFMIPNIISKAALALMFVFMYMPKSGVINTIVQSLGFQDFELNWLYNPNTAFISVTNIWLWYAAVITLITMAELLSISPNVFEAATIDGASEFQIDIYICIPMIRRIIGTGIIIAVTAVFKMFDIIFMTTNGGPGDKTINIAVMMVNRIIHTNRYGYANALGIILLIMGALVMAISNRTFKMSKKIDE